MKRALSVAAVLALYFALGFGAVIVAGCADDPPTVRVLVTPDSTLIGDQAVIVDVSPREVEVRIPAKSTLSGRTGQIQVASRGSRVLEAR